MSRTAERRDGPRPRRRRRRALGRALTVLFFLGTAGIVGLWIAVNRVAWLGPYVADGLRAVIGVDAVASLEDFSYRLQDRVNRLVRRGDKPVAHWQVPSTKPTAPPPAPVGAVQADPEARALPPFHLADVGPVHAEWSAPGDGSWVPMTDPDRPVDSPYMMKTLLHPDKNRSWAEVFVVAIDLRRVRLSLVAGTKEPAATEESAQNMTRPGVIPAEFRDSVLAAFNGGFKTEHGQYGMFVDHTLLVKPKANVCAIAGYEDDSVRIATWDELADGADKMVFWRETPVCMYEQDKLHFRLADPNLARKWGATLDGETVIRRSAIGIDRSREVLFVSISNHTTARVIADGMHHAGATTVAQLDVNFSYPKFVTFERKKTGDDAERKKRIAIPLADGFEFSEDEYIREASRRDFFYLLPKDGDARTALKARAE
ncbi:MAG TPA: hypothetical protein VHE30_18300 [Polyangiaceae bacterium]|nr:hypothetical protein [Polyangiaceae bacterium]